MSEIRHERHICQTTFGQGQRVLPHSIDPQATGATTRSCDVLVAVIGPSTSEFLLAYQPQATACTGTTTPSTVNRASTMMEPVFCNSCSKPFSSVPAVERHRLRCRFRPRTRKKACAECSRSKVRCDQGLPACSRCTIHALPCVYPHAAEVHAAPANAAHAASARTASSAAVSVSSTVSMSLPLTPSSDLGLPSRTSGVGQEAHLVHAPTTFSSPEWVLSGEFAWLPEGISLDDVGQGVEGSLLPTGLSPRMDNLLDLRQTPDPFQNLSSYLGDRWSTAEKGLHYLDRTLKGYVDNFSSGLRRPPFIHSNAWDPAHRPVPLAETAAIAHLYVNRCPGSESVLNLSIHTQLMKLQRDLANHTPAQDVVTAQVVVLCALMRIYRTGPIASEIIDRVPFRTIQHVLGKSIRCMTPHVKPNPSDWDTWLENETLRRCFFTIHALDYLTHARKSLPFAFCPLFGEAPLPAPVHIWEAPTAEEWAARYRAWEEYCGGGGGSSGHLRGQDMLAWAQGKETGHESHLMTWFQVADPDVVGVAVECAKAQWRSVGVEVLM